MEKRTILIVDDDIANSGGDLIVHLTSDGAVTFENSAPDWDRVSTERLFDRFFTVRGRGGRQDSGSPSPDS